MKIYLVRHGQTDWNVEGRMQGCRDIPLNDNGKKQMEELGERLHSIDLKIDCMISSPLNRAHESAQIIAKKMRYEDAIICDTDFVERSFGLAEGLIWNKDIDLDDEKYGAESLDEVCKRAKKAIEKYISSEEKSIMVVAHGAILSALKHVLSKGKIGYLDSAVQIIQGNVLCCEIGDGEESNFYNLFS